MPVWPLIGGLRMTGIFFDGHFAVKAIVSGLKRPKVFAIV